MTKRGAEIVSSFTPRELSVAALLCTGKRYREIAAQLNVEVFTVKNTIKGIYDKSGVNCRLTFVLLCAEFGMLAFDEVTQETA